MIEGTNEMDGFHLTLAGDLTAAVLCVSAAAIPLLSATVFVGKRNRLPTPAIRWHIVSGLGFAFAAVGVGFALHAMNVMTSAAGQPQPAASVSPEELQRGIKSLPVLEFDNQAVVFGKD